MEIWSPSAKSGDYRLQSIKYSFQKRQLLIWQLLLLATRKLENRDYCSLLYFLTKTDQFIIKTSTLPLAGLRTRDNQ